MEQNDLFTMALGLSKPWKVVRSGFEQVDTGGKFLYVDLEVEAHYSPGLAIRSVGGMFQTSQAEWGGAPDYSRQGTSWMTSDGQTGTGTPPSLEDLSWVPGLAGGYDEKYPDTDYGPVAWPEEVTTGVQLPSWIYDPGTVLVWAGGYFGKSKDRQKHVTSEVRIRRKTAAEGGGGSNEAITKAFVDLTEKTDASGVKTVVNCVAQNMTLNQDQSQSPPATLSTSAKVGEANKRDLILADILEVISDQIAGNDANKLPTAYFKDEPNNPMLMATRTGQKAKLWVKMASSDPKVYIGARKVGAQTILGALAVTTTMVLLEFDVPANSHDMYEVVAGYDANTNSTLDNNEARIVFKKTPKGTATEYLDLIDKIIIIDDGQFNESKNTIVGYNAPGSEYAGDLIEGFAKGTKTIPNATRTDQIPIDSKYPGLSHPLGGKWNAANTDSTYRFTFTDGSPASNNFEVSAALEQIVKKIIGDHKADMIAAYTGTPEWPVTAYYEFTEEKDLIKTETETIGINELGNAFGKVTIEGKLRISYRKTGTTAIEVGGVEVIGSFEDLYDFAYGGGARARQASMVQAGHASLAAGSEPDSGKVFFTRLEFNTGSANTWSGTY